MRTACEPFILARMGKAQARLTDVPNVIIQPAREHSRKPDQMRQIVERMTPNAFRAELFARGAWAGNDVWGNETEKFEGVK
jgi:N6-adenosine-specific RNA methylase IME4